MVYRFTADYYASLFLKVLSCLDLTVDDCDFCCWVLGSYYRRML